MVPPWWVRRLVLAPVVIALAGVAVTTLPVWVLLSVLASPLAPGRLRPLRVLWVATLHLVLETVLLVALAGLWLASGFGLLVRTPAFQRRHYGLVRWYLKVMYREATRALRVTVQVSGPPPDEYLGRPLLVFCRHAGPGDSLLLIHALINWYAREPRIVLKATLQWDPALDVLLNRLPNTFISPAPDRLAETVEAEIAALASGLDGDDAFVIFPEGGNFTEPRRRRAIERLRRLGLHRMARRAEQMRHVLAPRPGGVSAALAAAPDADVVWVAHTGVDHLLTVGDVWRELPMDKVITMRWWRVPADEVPTDRDRQIDWLFSWWERIDQWIHVQSRPPGS
ncbi:MAG TPA: 1-acyl-sn-glycerol-3-phosphate acyltransferase [Mycobacteriales bacterium]|nr:1-acyl-sn-glycerol-3-phosphate acyltransferase [Mycobacteriales bacterium]